MIEVIGAARIYEQLLSYISAMGTKLHPSCGNQASIRFPMIVRVIGKDHITCVPYTSSTQAVFPSKVETNLSRSSPLTSYFKNISTISHSISVLPRLYHQKVLAKKLKEGTTYSASPLNAAQRPFVPRPGPKPFSTCTSGLRPNDE